jgi:hypothetical protein
VIGDEQAQITMRELLDDPLFRKWISRPPKGFTLRPSWTVYAQREENGPWARATFPNFVRAHNFFVKNFRQWHDSALCCRNYDSRPPVVRDPNNPAKRRYHAPVLTIRGHIWCPYCRRPTVFKMFAKHHALKGRTPMPVERCSICGIARTSIKEYKVGRIKDGS